ncbi:cysteine hydrolase [Luteimonas yindakuii]|uniref:Cysteine hydrolase n=1 Tax=Luteimonas yindakuii TaxID=2565782 RepID=A0A4Z1R7G9_9GAMM|nr:isochorismatase family cysteine hydrolase [Luteimonas yindakuii]TKS54525.1 cysteine hydrolase [Luteimonas yindakuii]
MANADTALLIIDMINRFDFPSGAALARASEPVSKRIAWLRSRFQAAGWPVVLVNDNFMDWKADFREICAVCSHDGMPGAAIARRLMPVPGDYFVLKPKHSAFHASPLDALLSSLEVDRLVITGIAADACVLATALDAHMREYALAVPRDCVAAISTARRDRALALLRENCKADTRGSRSIAP